jgi:hypothetical protein
VGSDLRRKGVSIWWRVWRMCFCCSCLRILSLLSADFSWISCHDNEGNLVIMKKLGDPQGADPPPFLYAREGS